MKRYILLIFLVAITGSWIWLTTTHFKGLNSLLTTFDYNHGLSDLIVPEKKLTTTVKCGMGNATVSIDSFGIPHVFGDNDEAVAFATGYITARDRYFQMELMAYSVMGRLSEIIGENGTYSDQNWLRFEFEEKAEKVLDSLNKSQPELGSYLAAYTAGVNAYIRQESPQERDPMYLIWNCQPRPWKAQYSILLQWYMSFDLAYYDDYIDKQELLDKLPVKIRQLLYAENPKQLPMIVPDTPSLKEGSTVPSAKVTVFEMSRSNTWKTKPFNAALGSNNWAVSSQRTVNGELFLCNDLHLALTHPNIFYEIHLHSPTLNTYGFMLPGIPLILTGHNEKIAWGITNGGWDVTEQYLLKLDPDNRNRYWLDGKWETMSAKRFLMNIKGKASEPFDVKYTRIGPVVEHDSTAYALKWHPANWTAAAGSFWKLMRASSWLEFCEALRHYDYPSQNFIYGDVHGNIGILCAGKMPLKPAGYDGGLLDGTHSPSIHYIPFDSLPRSYNPVRGYLFSANQQPVSNRYYSSRWFSDLYRPKRIDEILSKNKKLTREDMKIMQKDVVDLSVKDVQVLVRKFSIPTTLSLNWKSILLWDGTLNAGDKNAAFYRAFREAAGNKCKQLVVHLKVKALPSFDQFINFLSNNQPLTADSFTFDVRSCVQQLIRETDSLYTIHLQKDWPQNAYTFTIPQMTYIPGMNISISNTGGSDNTINVNYSAHPVVRTLIEIKDQHIQSWMVNAIGQSGRINCRGYKQQLADWEANKLHKTQFVKEPIDVRSVLEKIYFFR